VTTRLLDGDPARELLRAAEDGDHDVLVMGSRARGPKKAVVLGSVSREVVGGAACPVLVLPRGASEMANRLASSVQARGPA